MNQEPIASHLFDQETEQSLRHLKEEEKIKIHRIAGVKTVLVVISTRGMVFDRESLKQKIRLTYPEAQVYFISTLGIAVGAVAPSSIDLVIDFTGPAQRRKWFQSKQLRRRGRMVVGRNVGPYRLKIYDRVYNELDEKNLKSIPKDLLAKERKVQEEVLKLAGVPLSQRGDCE
jgi:hypothetical protein